MKEKTIKRIARIILLFVILLIAAYLFLGQIGGDTEVIKAALIGGTLGAIISLLFNEIINISE